MKSEQEFYRKNGRACHLPGTMPLSLSVSPIDDTVVWVDALSAIAGTSGITGFNTSLSNGYNATKSMLDVNSF